MTDRMESKMDMPIGEGAVTARVRERILSQRKRRIGRLLLLVTAVSIGMVFVAMASRDSQTQRNEARLSGRIAQALQESLDKSGSPPRAFPDFGPSHREMGKLYEFNVLYPDMARASTRVGVCAPRSRVPFYLRGSGRYIVTFDGKKFGTAWLTDEALRAERTTLGFSTRLTD